MKENTQKPLEKIRFVYEKARHHRTFHADGAWASTTPQGEIQFSFFNDLRPLPHEQIHSVGEDGILGQEIPRTGTEAYIIREANVTVVMNTEAIKALIALFGNILQRTAQANESISQQQDSQKAPK